MTCVFALSGDQLERFGAEDMALVSGVLMHEEEETQDTQPVAPPVASR
jgi:hypothetical protein